MRTEPLTIFRLVTAMLLPVVVTVLFYLAEKKSRFGKLSNPVKQGIIGASFGIIAILATEFGIPVDGAVLNVRNAAPLTAGLVFGWPAGLVAGFMGGIERWFSSAGDFTRLACTIGTIISGFLGASVRKFMIDNKKASWFYGLVVGITSEVLHMLMVFLSNASDIQRAFHIVQIVAIPMIFANGLSVMLSIVCVSLLTKPAQKQATNKENISQTFQRWLLLGVMLAFIITSIFTYSFQTQIADATTKVMLETAILDVKEELQDITDDSQLQQIAKNRHVGQEGSIFICDAEGNIVSGKDREVGRHVSVLGEKKEVASREGELFSARIYDEEARCMYTTAGDYYILGVLTEEEATFSRNAAVYMLAFMEVVVFAVLFVFVFVLIKKLVVENVQRINASLEQITGGNLEITVDVRTNEEFVSLSEDINSTVATLKRYIAEAEARIDKELKIAKQIQHSALPSDFTLYRNRRDFSVYATMDTAKEVGGDFYDFYLLGENRLAFLIADVSGKGIPAAMFMMNAKALIKGFAESGLEVNDVFTVVNEKLCEGNDAEMFVTAWMGILDLITGVVKYANAGHNPPVLKRQGGSFEYLKTKRNFILAGMQETQYKMFEFQMQPGDELYLYTDGVTEAQNADKQLFGEECLLMSLNEKEGLSAEACCKKVKADVDAFVGEAEQFDDITMLCLKWNGAV